MNIIVKPYGSDSFYCRPDTTWERENKDFYSPEPVNGLDWSPILFVRISKAGKCIGSKFASRYYDAFGFGVLMYISNFMPDLASASCADHTSLLPQPSHGPEEIENEHNTYEIIREDRSIFNMEGGPSLKAEVEAAICRASQLTSLRIGDFVAVELAPVGTLAGRGEGEVPVKVQMNGKILYDFRVIF